MAALDFKASSVTAVDVDDVLIEQAKERLTFRLSRVLPAHGPGAVEIDYFPVSAVIEHGTLRSLSTGLSTKMKALGRVDFVCEDWVLSENTATLGPFDVILAFSVLKWVHLEHLDEGLRLCFQKFASCLRPEGHLFLDIQPKQSYEKAVSANKAPHYASNLTQLTIWPDSYDTVLAESGLMHVVSSTELPRRVSIYRKITDV